MRLFRDVISHPLNQLPRTVIRAPELTLKDTSMRELIKMTIAPLPKVPEYLYVYIVLLELRSDTNIAIRTYARALVLLSVMVSYVLYPTWSTCRYTRGNVVEVGEVDNVTGIG